MKELFKNPMTIWLKWLIHKKRIERRFRDRNVWIGYLAQVSSDCIFGYETAVFDRSILVATELGDYSYVGPDCKFHNVTVGKFCSIADNVRIGLPGHPVDRFVSTHPAFFSTRFGDLATFADRSYFNEGCAPVIIGHDVWIGLNATILSGVKIGTGAIIGAGSIVTKDVPPYAIVAGIPARVARFRFSDHQIQQLLDSGWWEWPISDIKKTYKQFHDIDVFLEWIHSQEK